MTKETASQTVADAVEFAASEMRNAHEMLEAITALCGSIRDKQGVERNNPTTPLVTAIEACVGKAWQSLEDADSNLAPIRFDEREVISHV